MLYGAGATLVLVTLALSSSDRASPGLVGPPIAAYCVVALTVVRNDRLPLWLFRALPAFGGVLISILAFSAATETFNAYALLYFWVIPRPSISSAGGRRSHRWRSPRQATRWPCFITTTQAIASCAG